MSIKIKVGKTYIFELLNRYGIHVSFLKRKYQSKRVEVDYAPGELHTPVRLHEHPEFLRMIHRYVRAEVECIDPDCPRITLKRDSIRFFEKI
jgi:hypothetical protein